MGDLVDIFHVSGYPHPARSHLAFGHGRLLFEQRNFRLRRKALWRCLSISKYSEPMGERK